MAAGAVCKRLASTAFCLQAKRWIKAKNIRPLKFTCLRATALISLDCLAVLDGTRRKGLQPKQKTRQAARLATEGINNWPIAAVMNLPSGSKRPLRTSN